MDSGTVRRKNNFGDWNESITTFDRLYALTELIIAES